MHQISSDVVDEGLIRVFCVHKHGSEEKTFCSYNTFYFMLNLEVEFIKFPYIHTMQREGKVRKYSVNKKITIIIEAKLG